MKRWRIRAVVTYLFCAGALISVCGAGAQSDEQNVQKIIMLLRLDEYGRSLTSVNQMLNATPHDCRLLSLREDCAERPGEARGSG